MAKKGGFCVAKPSGCVTCVDCLPCTYFKFGLVCHNCIPRFILNFDSFLSFWQKSFQRNCSYTSQTSHKFQCPLSDIGIHLPSYLNKSIHSSGAKKL